MQAIKAQYASVEKLTVWFYGGGSSNMDGINKDQPLYVLADYVPILAPKPPLLEPCVGKIESPLFPGLMLHAYKSIVWYGGRKANLTQTQYFILRLLLNFDGVADVSFCFAGVLGTRRRIRRFCATKNDFASQF